MKGIPETFKMGCFTTQVTLKGANPTDFLVDTGAHYSMAPSSTLYKIGVKPTSTRLVEFADGRTSEMPIGIVDIQIEGCHETWPTIVLFGEEGCSPILGAFALEAFALGVDPIKKRLIPLNKVWAASAPKKKRAA